MAKQSKQIKHDPNKPMTINQMIALFRRIIESDAPSAEPSSQTRSTEAG